mgnify:CR=1 FL=1
MLMVSALAIAWWRDVIVFRVVARVEGRKRPGDGRGVVSIQERPDLLVDDAVLERRVVVPPGEFEGAFDEAETHDPRAKLDRIRIPPPRLSSLPEAIDMANNARRANGNNLCLIMFSPDLDSNTDTDSRDGIGRS